MTSDSAFKRAVRERMQNTGEKYTQARRAIAADPALGSQDPVRAALQPGRVVGIVCGGGATNLGLVIPHLIALQDRGHHLTFTSERKGLFEVPGPFDFVCARGLLSAEAMGELILADDDPEVGELVAALPSASVSPGPLPPGTWRTHLAAKATTARAPIVWVQDIQVGPPLALGRNDDIYDAIAQQLAGLRDIATETGAIVAVGHCMPYDSPEGWDVIVDGADDTFVIDSDDARSAGGVARGATIEHHSHDAPPASFRRTIDTSFSDWRLTVIDGS